MSGQDMVPNYDDIAEAACRLRGNTYATPVRHIRQANKSSNAQLFFKCENFQRGGAIGFRGAYNALSGLNTSQRRGGVLAYSAGNHALGVAIAAKMLQIQATILMPLHTPLPILAQVRASGATLILCDPAKNEFQSMTERLTASGRLTIIPPHGHCDVAAGCATAVKELFEEAGPLDYLFVPFISGSLMAASVEIAGRHSSDCVIVGVTQTGQWPSLPAAASTDDLDGECDVVGRMMMGVNDTQIRRQMRFFAEEMKMIVEPIGALAAVAAFDVRFDPGARVGVIVSGGNISPQMFNHMIGGNVGEPQNAPNMMQDADMVQAHACLIA